MTIHRKVQVWIFHNPLKNSSIQCLLLQTNQKRGLFWQPVTGSVEPGESDQNAALREAMEETNLPFDQTKPIDAHYEFDFDSRFGPAHESVFALTTSSAANPRLDPHEHQNFQWTTPQKALEILKFPTNKEGLHRAFEAVFGKVIPTLLISLFFFANTLLAAQDARVVSESATIREFPRKDAAILESKKSGDPLRISSESKDGWFKTRTSSGKMGWIYQGDLNLSNFETSYNFGALERNNRQSQGYQRRIDFDQKFGVRLGVGPSYLFPSAINLALGRSILKNFPSLSMMGQFSYNVNESSRLLMRFERFTASGQVGGYRLEFTGMPLYVGGEFDLMRAPRWRSFWNLMFGMGLSDSITVTNTDDTNGVRSATIKGNPLAAATAVGLQYSLTPWLRLSSELGIRIAQTLQGAEASNTFEGDEPTFRSGSNYQKIRISEHGIFLFGGIEFIF